MYVLAANAAGKALLATTLQTMAGPAATEGVVQAQSIANLAAQHIQLQQQLAEVQQTTAALKVAAQLEQRLADFDAHMAAGKMLPSIVRVAAMRLLETLLMYHKQQSSVLAGSGQGSCGTRLSCCERLQCRPGALRVGLQAVKREAAMTNLNCCESSPEPAEHRHVTHGSCHVSRV